MATTAEHCIAAIGLNAYRVDTNEVAKIWLFLLAERCNVIVMSGYCHDMLSVVCRRSPRRDAVSRPHTLPLLSFRYTAGIKGDLPFVTLPSDV